MNKTHIQEFNHSIHSITRLKEKLKLESLPVRIVGGNYKEVVKVVDVSGPRSVRFYPSKIMYNNKVYTGHLTSLIISELFNIKTSTIYQRYLREKCFVYAMKNGMCIFCSNNLKINYDNYNSINELFDDILNDIEKDNSL